MSEYLDRCGSVDSPIGIYNPAKEYIMDGKCILDEPVTVGRYGDDLIQSYFSKLPDKLRMHGSPHELEENIKIYRNFPGSDRYFKAELEPYYTTPIIYESLKNEKFICKADIFVMLQSMVIRSFTRQLSDINILLTAYFLKSKEKRVSKQIEYVPLERKVFDEIWREVQKISVELETDGLETLLNELTKLNDQEYYKRLKALIPLEANQKKHLKELVHAYSEHMHALNPEKASSIRAFIYIEVQVIIKHLQKIIEKRPELFLPRSETKDNKLPFVVRIFEDGDHKFVMKAELYNALRNCSSLRIQHKDTENMFATMKMEDVQSLYKQKIRKIEFIRCPIQRAKHRAVLINGPDPTDSENLCILAIDSFFEYLRALTTELRVFQTWENSIDSSFGMTFELMEQLYFLTDQECPYFMRSKMFKILDLAFDASKNHLRSPRVIRDVNVDGFTVQDLKNELTYLGLVDTFSEILEFAEVVYAHVDKNKNEMHLRTCDLFDALEYCQLNCLFKRLPNFRTFVHKQGGCGRVPGYKCEYCGDKKEEDKSCEILPPVEVIVEEAPLLVPIEPDAEWDETNNKLQAEIPAEKEKKLEDSKIIEALEAKIAKLELENADEKERSKDLEGDLLAKSADNFKTRELERQKSAEFTAKISKFSDENRRMIIELVAEKKKTKKLEDNIKSMKKEHIELVEIRAELSEMVDKVNQAKIANAATTEKWEKFEAELPKKFAMAREEDGKKIEELKAKISQLSDENNQMKAEMSAEKEKSKKLEDVLLNSTAKSREGERKIIDELKAENKRVKIEISAEQEKTKKLKNDLLSKVSELDTRTTGNSSLTQKEKMRVINGKFGLPPGMIRKSDFKKIQSMASHPIIDKQDIKIVVTENRRIRPIIDFQTDDDHLLTIKVGIPPIETDEKSIQTEKMMDFGRSSQQKEKESQEEVQKLKKKLTGFEKKLAEAKAENERNVEKWKRDLKKKQDEVEELRRKIAADDIVARSNQRLVRELKDKNAEIAEVRQELTAQINTSKKSHAKIEKLESELKNQHKENEKLRKSIDTSSRCTVENQEMKRKMEQIEQNEIRLKDAYSRIRSNFDDSRVKFSERIAEMGHALRCEKQKLVMSESRVLQLKAQLEGLGSDRNSHEKRLLQQEIERKNDFIRKLEDSNSILARQNSENTDMVRDLLTKLKTRIPPFTVNSGPELPNSNSLPPRHHLKPAPLPIGSERPRHVDAERSPLPPVSPVPVELLQLPKLAETSSPTSWNDYDDVTTVIQATITKKCTVTRTATTTKNNNTWQQHHHQNNKEFGELIDSQCVICLVDMEAGDCELIKCHECRRRFHGECASEWLKVKSICPICKGSLLDPREFPAL